MFPVRQYVSDKNARSRSSDAYCNRLYSQTDGTVPDNLTCPGGGCGVAHHVGSAVVWRIMLGRMLDRSVA